MYTDNLSLYNTLDADGVVLHEEVAAAVKEMRDLLHGGSMATVTWPRAHGQLADALTKSGRETRRCSGSSAQELTTSAWRPRAT